MGSRNGVGYGELPKDLSRVSEGVLRSTFTTKLIISQFRIKDETAKKREQLMFLLEQEPSTFSQGTERVIEVGFIRLDIF